MSRGCAAAQGGRRWVGWSEPLTLGTASPHLVRGLGQSWPWQLVVLTSSALTLGAGAMILCWAMVRPRRRGQPNGAACSRVFRRPLFAAQRSVTSATCGSCMRFWFLVPKLVAGVLTGRKRRDSAVVLRRNRRRVGRMRGRGDHQPALGQSARRGRSARGVRNVLCVVSVARCRIA